IIGGGLTGLTAAISLAERGRRAAIVSAGQSALHFSSGSFELLGSIDGRRVDNPVEAIDHLPERHPYRRIGKERMLQLLPLVQPLLTRAGVATTGSHYTNRYRLTPLGKVKPAWLTLDDFATFDSPDRLPWRSVALVNIADFQDFYPVFLAAGLEKRGVKCSIHSTSIAALDNLRRSSTEMRATTMARVLDYEAVGVLAGRLNSVARHADAILMPAILGLTDDLMVRLLRRLVCKPVYFVSTMPTSVPGVRTQMLLQRYFMKLGGTYMLGDTVTHGEFDGDRLRHVFTTNHSPEPLSADNYILATGSFFSHGLVATPSAIVEPTFGFDVDAPADRAQWFRKDIDSAQPYMEFGIATDADWHPRRDGVTIGNVQCAGSILGGCNPVKEGCGAGVAILSSLNLTAE
ncbi:MAG: glycerol-3-phosphate dehydrogenase subunit GlpB, partial [Muribaculaceae bacterium]|nr:glycerol-3-phosphate dehydrogenase subunit GlpB [Muribaculaceae bacterium]